MSGPSADPIAHPEVQGASSVFYGAAFALGMGLMLLACAITLSGGLSSLGLLAALLVIGAVVIIGQLYLLFKLDLAPSRIWQTVSLVLTVPLLFIAIVLSGWMFHTLTTRTTIGGWADPAFEAASFWGRSPLCESRAPDNQLARAADQRICPIPPLGEPGQRERSRVD